LESVNIAKINVALARLNFEYTKIRSPIDGLIGEERITPGNLVRADDTSLAEVVDLSLLRAVFEMDERTLLRMHRASEAKKAKLDKLEVTLRLADGQELARKGVVEFVDSRVNPKTGSIRVTATVPNPDRKLLPGMFVRISLRLDFGADNKK
jgi:RND family efflux transporter MFP subunit